MSYHFSAEQFEKSFTPKRLGNWEIPQWYPRRPRAPDERGPTTPLAEVRGRLLPRAKRLAPAWGWRRTAWDYPKRITREIAEELSKVPPPGRYAEWQSKQNKRDEIEKVENNEENDVQNTERDEFEQEREIEYKPGSVTEPDQRVQSPVEALDLKQIEDADEPAATDFCNLDEMKKSGTLKDGKKSSATKCEHKLPAIDPFARIYYARKMHRDNLEHHPLPDALGTKETNFRPIPGRDLDVKPYSSVWKTPINAVEQRPVTSVGAKKYLTSVDKSNKMRPATTEGDKSKKIQMKDVNPMDLAICWDFRTGNPRDEPKRSKHIDGSNGSKAPAVFSMVHSPKVDLHAHPETGRSNAIFSQNIVHDDFEDNRILPCFDKDMSKNRRKDACDTPKCAQHAYYNKENNENHDKTNCNGRTKHLNADRIDSPLQQNQNNKNCDGIHGCGSADTRSSRINTSRRINGKENRMGVRNAWTEDNNNHVLKQNYPLNDRNVIEKYKLSERRKSTDVLNNNNDSCRQSPLEKNKLCQSSPNIFKMNSDEADDELSSCSKRRNHAINKCAACHDSRKNSNDTGSKTEYKMAFKAGKPNSTGSAESKNGDSGSNTTKSSVKVPKMKDPYGKKSYSIPTLAPPFSRYRDASGYPEHWRLASVYQHAYKTPGPKRRPLLPAVYQ